MDPFTRMEQTMSTCNPVDLLFDGMAKLGPGSDADTRHVLSLLPRRDFRVIVDAGCGAGRQTLVLARELLKPVHAVDSYQPFLVTLGRRARDDGLGHLVRTHCMDMKDIPETFGSIDLLWAEGAATTSALPTP
jgi:cyclopropane fatty-acyl-phospholipid synthase-like methyltransferase